MIAMVFPFHATGCGNGIWYKRENVNNDNIDNAMNILVKTVRRPVKIQRRMATPLACSMHINGTIPLGVDTMTDATSDNKALYEVFTRIVDIHILKSRRHLVYRTANKNNELHVYLLESIADKHDISLLWQVVSDNGAWTENQMVVTLDVKNSTIETRTYDRGGTDNPSAMSALSLNEWLTVTALRRYHLVE